ncbi:hypothetical protein [Streptomyces sp. JHA26]|nr:hypothetical protein [Streptomyces sp. JHA26]
MKIARKTVLAGWILAAALGVLGGATASTDTVSTAGGASTFDTGWG